MILNIFGPSGSGKTTFLKNLIRKNNIQTFYKSYVTKYKIKKNERFTISLSLIPLPIYRGRMKDFFEIYDFNFENFDYLNKDFKELFFTIFKPNKDEKFQVIKNRLIETLSAGEMRRLFILKSLIIDSDMLAIDEPFSNSDKKLWDIIIKSIENKKHSILLSHMPLDQIFPLKNNFIKVDIRDIDTRFCFTKIKS
tara:strand:+ start:595 stop:1179 length:585 start_codon:yes stop_codon:yes gene_type:complete